MIFLLKFLRFFYGLIFLLPAPTALFMLRIGGKIVFHISRLTPIKKITANNYLSLFPDKDSSQLADNLLNNISHSIFEMLCTPFFNQSHLKELFIVDGLENIEASLVKRKGVLLLTMHTGNYELLPIFLVSKHYKTNSILKAPPGPIFKFLNQSRRYKGINLINVLETNMYRAALKALSKNQLVAMLIDTGALEGKHEFIDFLGKKVPVATGWITLAERSGASVIPTTSKREGDKIHLTFHPPLSIYRDNWETAKEKVKLIFEAFIKAHPDQWALFLNSHEIQRMIGK